MLCNLSQIFELVAKVSNCIYPFTITCSIVGAGHRFSPANPGIRGGGIDQEKRLEAEAKTNDNLSHELTLVRNQINIPIPVVDGGSTYISFEISYTV